MSEQSADTYRSALEVIYKTVRGDEKSECWAIRKWLNDRDVFNDDLSGQRRLIEAVCVFALAGWSPATPQRDRLDALEGAVLNLLERTASDSGDEITVERASRLMRRAFSDFRAASPQERPAEEHTCHDMNPPFPGPCRACEVESTAQKPADLMDALRRALPKE